MLSEPWNHASTSKWSNSRLHGTKPNIDGIDFKIYKDDATAFIDYQAENLDWCHVPSGQYKNVAAQYGVADDGGLTINPGKQVQNGAELASMRSSSNSALALQEQPVSSPALCLAVNRQRSSTPSSKASASRHQIIPAGTPAIRRAFQYAKYDVEAAKAALVKAGTGWQGLPTIPLSYNNNASHESIMQLVQADLKPSASIPPSMALTARRIGQGRKAARTSSSPQRLDRRLPAIDNFIYNLYYSKGGTTTPTCRSGIDKAITDARSMTDATASLAAEQAAVKLIGDYARYPDHVLLA